MFGVAVLECWCGATGEGIAGGTRGAAKGTGGFDVADVAIVGFSEGAGGGGMAPLGGPYCSMGRKTGCGAGLFGSLTAYTVASKLCGSREMVTWPTLAMLSLGGFFGSS